MASLIIESDSFLRALLSSLFYLHRLSQFANRSLPDSRHSDPLPEPTESTESVATPLKEGSSAERADIAENVAKNADLFTANASQPEEAAPAANASEDVKAASDSEAKSDPAAEEESKLAQNTAEAPVATEAKETSTEEPVEAKKEEAEEAAQDAVTTSAVVDAMDVDAEKEIAAEGEKQPNESVIEASPESAPVVEEPAVAAEPPKTDELAPVEELAAPSPVADAKEADVEMADAPKEAPAASAPAKTPAQPKPKSPATPAPAAHSHSSLLPSLRDDRSRENSSAAGNSDSIVAEPPAKVAREREDDDDDGPTAKRTKTAEAEAPTDTAQVNKEDSVTVSTEMQIDAAPVVMPPRVRASTKVGSLADPALDNSPISAYANREIRRVLASVKKTKAGLNFKDPVYKKWPGLWESYTARVAKPMDISQLERNLREGAYAVHADFVDDVFLIFENSVSFNGLGNAVTDEAKSLVDNFFARMSDISAQEPQKTEKKEPKQLPTRQAEPRAAASRRESRGAAASPIEDSVTAIAASPITVATSFPAASAALTSPVASAPPAEASTPVFAVPSSGVPIIRRDSTKQDGDRPKRPIHPPKNRDLGYEPKNPKKKQPEFRFCEEVLKELMKAKHYEINHWFLKPVDPVAMQIPTYHKVIKKPMDLGTMQTKLNLGEYGSAKDFENDFGLIVKNCRKFNVVGEVVDAANRLEDLFKLKWSEKDTWIAAHTAQTPAVVSPLAAKDEDSDEEGDDSEEEGDEISAAPLSSDTVDALVKRLDEENARLNKLLMAKVPDMTMITTQQTVSNMIQKQIVEEKIKLAAAEAERRTKKPAKAKTAKGKRASAAGGRKSGVGASAKKAGGGIVKKAPKARILGQAEKNVVTDGINNLEGPQLEKAIDIIKKDTHQEVSVHRCRSLPSCLKE